MFHRPRIISLRKALFVLPNLFTLAATFCGLYSMLLASQASRPWDYWAAAWLIGFAGILDAVDGRVARLTRTQSRFGLELDTLSDNVAFGVAPAWLVYHWGLQSLYPVGFFVAFAFTAAVSIRLARFNVIAKDDGDSRYFLGMSSPIGAALIAGMVLVHSTTGSFGAPASSQLLVAATVIAVALLMVSNVRFRSFKRINLRRRRTLLLVGTVLAGLTYSALTSGIEYGLLACVLAYVALHLAEAVVHLERRLLGRTGSTSETEELVLDLDDAAADEDDEESIVF